MRIGSDRMQRMIDTIELMQLNMGSIACLTTTHIIVPNNRSMFGSLRLLKLLMLELFGRIGLVEVTRRLFVARHYELNVVDLRGSVVFVFVHSQEAGCCCGRAFFVVVGCVQLCRELLLLEFV